MFLGFELRHPEQEAEHVELVASRQPGQLGNGLGNDGRGLVRASLACWFIAPPPALMRARPPATAFGQPVTSSAANYHQIRLLSAQLWEANHNFLDINSRSLEAQSTSVHLTGGSAAPMFGTKRPTRISRNRPLFFP